MDVDKAGSEKPALSIHINVTIRKHLTPVDFNNSVFNDTNVCPEPGGAGTVYNSGIPDNQVKIHLVDLFNFFLRRFLHI
jgi:hypothetical protein